MEEHDDGVDPVPLATPSHREKHLVLLDNVSAFRYGPGDMETDGEWDLRVEGPDGQEYGIGFTNFSPCGNPGCVIVGVAGKWCYTFAFTDLLASCERAENSAGKLGKSVDDALGGGNG